MEHLKNCEVRDNVGVRVCGASDDCAYRAVGEDVEFKQNQKYEVNIYQTAQHKCYQSWCMSRLQPILQSDRWVARSHLCPGLLR